MPSLVYTKYTLSNQALHEKKASKSVTCQYRNKWPHRLNTTSPVDIGQQTPTESHCQHSEKKAPKKPKTSEKLVSSGVKKPQSDLKRQPKYIQACENESWTLNLTSKKTGENRYVPFKCRSWRHDGDCARFKGRQDFDRISKAIKKLGDKWVYMVLTFDRSKSLVKSYKKIVDCWAKFRKRLTRKWGKFKYVALIEQHGDGFPHVNLLIYNEALFEATKGDGFKKVREEWFNEHVKASGFGWKYWVEEMRSGKALSGYFVKLIGQMSAEFTKPSQIPKSAPKNFRRLRASKGLLEKVFKNEDLTGEIIKIPVSFFKEKEVFAELFSKSDSEKDFEKFLERKNGVIFPSD